MDYTKIDELTLKNGITAIIRKAVPEDASSILEYLKQVGSETDFLTFGAEGVPFSKDQEKEFIKSLNNDRSQLMAVAVVNDEIAAILTFEREPLSRTKHSGIFGVSILKKYWGYGLGSHLMTILIEWAKSTKVIKKINLNVHVKNERAITLYKKFGFKEEGITAGYTYVDGVFHDAYRMGLFIE